MTNIQEIAENITDIRYNKNSTKIVFTYCGQDCLIKINNNTPLLVEYPDEGKLWIAKHYGFVLSCIKD